MIQRQVRRTQAAEVVHVTMLAVSNVSVILCDLAKLWHEGGSVHTADGNVCIVS